jgi:hypothetical protein
MSSIAIMDEQGIFSAPNFLQRAFKRLSDELSADAEDWGTAVQGLHRFQDEKLLGNPTPENLKAHRRAIELLITFGNFIANATKDPVFPNRETHAMVEATLQILRDDLALWHGNQNTPEKSAQILAACFPA